DLSDLKTNSLIQTWCKTKAPMNRMNPVIKRVVKPQLPIHPDVELKVSSGTIFEKKDGSTTSNLINHLARKHRIFKDSVSRSSNIIINQFIRTESEYELIRQNLILFIIDDSQAFNIDGERLAHIMLTNSEWTFLDELNDILSGFEEITTLLSGNTYITISLIYPAISALVKTLKASLQQFYIESVLTDINELTILDAIEEVIDDIKDFVEIREVDPELGIIHKKIDISIPMVTNGMLEKFKKVLYDSMHKYWQSVTNIGMLACLLDPRFKKLHFTNISVIQRTNEHLKQLYEIESRVYMASQHSASLSNIQEETFEISRIQRKHKSILSDLYAADNPINEIDEYLSLEEEGGRTNPFQWWKIKKKRFPILSQIA
ncbi:23415_t:CDS:2, partial [Cetraspora pellucida]